MSLTALVIATLLIAVSISSHDAFASDENGGPKQKHIDKHEEKHEDKNKDKHEDKNKDKHEDKNKDKHEDKQKEKLVKKIKEIIIDKIKEKIADYKEKSSKKMTSEVEDDSVEQNTATSDNDDEVDNDTSNYDEENTPDVQNNEDNIMPIPIQEETKHVMNQFKGSGNDYAPTLGNDRYGNNYVDNGFTFNNFVTDVENFKTHMPLQTLQVGEKNTAVLKIYDNRGASKIEHVELAFGLDYDEHASQSKNKIIWKQNFKGEQFTLENDPSNLLMDVSAEGKANGKIMEITFNFAFREPMDKSMIGLVVWDQEKHSRAVYFNEGIEVEGESLNPPETIIILDDKGLPVNITITGKNEGVDEFGNLWTHNSPWKKQNVENHVDEVPEPVGTHGFDRTHGMFDSYKNTQAQNAQEKLLEILGGNNIYNFND